MNFREYLLNEGIIPKYKIIGFSSLKNIINFLEKQEKSKKEIMRLAKDAIKEYYTKILMYGLEKDFPLLKETMINRYISSLYNQVSQGLIAKRLNNKGLLKGASSEYRNIISNIRKLREFYEKKA